MRDWRAPGTTLAPLELAPWGPDVSVITGVDGLRRLESTLRPFLAIDRAPCTARWPWLIAWAEAHSSWTPVAVTIVDGSSIAGAALLAQRRRGPLTDIVMLGHGQSDYARLPVRPGFAGRLASAIATTLSRGSRPWRLRLEQLPESDPTLTALAQRLPSAELTTGDASPWIAVLPGCDPEQSLPQKTRARARNARNRVQRDGLTLDFEVTRTASSLDRLVPVVESVHRSRDRALRGRSELDDDEHRAFWRRAICEAAADGNVEVAIAWIDGAVAAYVVALLDGASYRIWDTRINPAYARYAPGHLIRSELLPRLSAQGRFTSWDWMRGTEEYKLATTKRLSGSSKLQDWRPRGVERAERAWKHAARVRQRVARLAPMRATPSR
jgi:CelD/BcsL family acetyltransferase involved in cellulose biosynthesis